MKPGSTSATLHSAGGAIVAPSAGTVDVMPELRYPDPPLADDVVRLRPWSDADVDAAHAATQDPLIPRFTRIPEQQTKAQLRAFIADRDARRIAGEVLACVIADPRSDALLGSVALMRFDWDEHRAEIGYWLAPQARGRGVATRAVALLARWALRELGLARLAITTDVDNLPSQAVAERCGFTREGVLRAFQERNGRRFDVVMYSLLPEDLE
jgi:RimJ/RimL family protein N-acetyltransferase